MFRTVLVPKNRDIHIKLPAMLLGKEVEIIANVTNQRKKYKIRAKTESWKEIREFYYSINIDTENYKFDRDEANER